MGDPSGPNDIEEYIEDHKKELETNHRLLSAKGRFNRPITAIPIDWLFPRYKIENPIFHNKIKNSIIKHGMQYPIIVSSTSYNKWKAAKQNNPGWLDAKDCLKHTPEPFMIWCGHNRYYAAKELGYDLIECVVESNPTKRDNICQWLRDRWNVFERDKKWPT